MKKILLIEDQRELAEQIQRFLKKKGYSLQWVCNLEQARVRLKEVWDLALLDMGLPDGFGLELLTELKERGIKTLIITVKNDEDFIVKALDSGADDYLVKPCSLEVLRARIDLALREELLLAKNQICFRGFTVDEENHCIFLHGELLDLTQKEREILTLFIRHPHKIFTRDFLMERFWDSRENYVNDNTLTVTIKRLREKIKGEQILTLRGIGYKLD